MKNPGRDLPRAIVGGVSIIMAVYFIINMAYLWVIPAHELMNYQSPAAEVAMRIFGPVGGTLKVGIIISVIGAANGFPAFRLPRCLLPWRNSVHPLERRFCQAEQNSVSTNSIILVGFLGCLYSVAQQFDMLTDLAVFSCWIFYTLTFACVMTLRRKQPNLDRKYKVPLYPVIPILAVPSSAVCMLW